MGSVGRKIAGAVLTAAGVVIGITTQQWALAAAVSSTGIGLLTSPKLPTGAEGDLNERQGQVLENRTGALERLPVVYGTARIAGAFVDIRVDDNSHDRKRLVVVVAYCHGSQDGGNIDAVDLVYFDDRLAVAASSAQAPFNKLVQDEGGTHYLELEHHLGSTAQTVDTRLNSMFPAEWPVTSAGAGIAYSRFELWYDADVYPSGLPTIQAKIRGNRVYDPRTLSWAHSTNPVLCIRDYLTSPIYGLGVPAANLDEQSFIDMANYCDELVSAPSGGTQKRYEMNGWVDTGRSVEQNLAQLCTACRAQVVNEGELWRIIIRRQRTISDFEISAENTVEGSWQFLMPAADAVPNVARASFVDPGQNYDVDTVQWPEPGDANPYLDDDNGFEQRLEIDLPFTQDRFMAQQLAMTALKEARQAIGVTMTLQESALQVRVGDLVPVTHETPGWVQKTFDVVALMLLPDARVQAVLVEYEPTVYDLDDQPDPPAIPDTNLPNPLEIAAPTSLVLVANNQALQTNDGRYLPRIRVTWQKSADAFIDFYEIQAKKTTDADWDTYGRVPAAAVPIFYVGPVTDEEWDVQIRAVNRLGRVSDWVSGTILVVTDDPRPQILSITMAPIHSDAHSDIPHSDVAHADNAHVDAHSDEVHIDAHADMHSDHADSNHQDDHDDVHGDGDHHIDAHDDHADFVHADFGHTDSHDDEAHIDAHSDVRHGDSAHGDGHTDSHSDGQYGVGVALQADTDSASVRAVARKHADVAHSDHVDGVHSDVAHSDITDPTVVDVRGQAAVDGRNVMLELIDAATGSQILLEPGDQIRIGAIAYSKTGGGGVEGPMAIGTASHFPVAPVGTNKWVPS